MNPVHLTAEGSLSRLWLPRLTAAIHVRLLLSLSELGRGLGLARSLSLGP